MARNRTENHRFHQDTGTGNQRRQLVSEAPNRNQFWANLMVEELIRCGCTVFFAAPGSRSTPLVTAAFRNPRADVRMHFDERGTAFMALGYGKATGLPAAWITTSGTALANGYPAIVEAGLEEIPMVLLTADRPPELRDSDAPDHFLTFPRLHLPSSGRMKGRFRPKAWAYRRTTVHENQISHSA